MKSREEYQTSIFAKRDALLQKRKKRISRAAAGAGIAVLFAAAFVIIPNIPERIPQNDITETTFKTAEPEGIITSQSASSEEYLAYIFNFSNETYSNEGTNSQMTEAEESATPADEMAEEIESGMTDCAGTPEETTKRKGSASVIDGLIYKETKIYIEEAMPTPDSGEDNISQSSNDETAPNKFTTEEIIAAAIKHLPDERKEAAADAKTSVIPVTDPNCSYYFVCFDTENGSIQVKLNGQTLAHMETLVIPPKTIVHNAETVTHREGYKGD